jgi:glycosyltransferase involved in cell wall biosynthesis
MAESLVRQDISAIALSWNGKKRGLPKWMKGDLPLDYVHTPWCDSFAEQRQASLEIVKRKSPEAWVLWIDTDDTLEGDIHEAMDEIQSEHTTGAFMRYDYGVDPDTGVVVVEQQRERVLCLRTNWRWRHRVHEVCYAPPGTQMAWLKSAWMRHHRVPGEDRATRTRNDKLIRMALEEGAEERFLMYMANEEHARGVHDDLPREERLIRLNNAIQMYKQFVKQQPTTDDGYLANHRIADVQRELGDYNSSIDTDLQGLKLRPSWPDSYNGISATHLMVGEFARAEEWATACIKLASKPTTTQVIEAIESTYQPYLNRGVARAELGRVKGALKDLRRAQSVYPTKSTAELIEKLEAAEPRAPVVKTKTRYPSLGSKSIAFFTRPTFEPWHPDIEAEKGMGGAETCIMRLAPRFADDGWDVTVYGTPGEHIGIDDDGVQWVEMNDFIAAVSHDVVVSSRSPELFDANINAGCRLLWMHDVNCRDDLLHLAGFGNRLSRIDAIIGLSQWHARHLSELYDTDKVIVVPNGLDTSLYQAEIRDNREPRFVYASSPDRGLDVLLGMWPKIRERWPTATLDVFYGWSSIDAILARMGNTGYGAHLNKFKRYVTGLVETLGSEEGGIYMRGRVPQAQLAKELYGYTAWLYPTFFMETFCITALEMQAAGVLPVTSDLAALSENVVRPGVSGWPNNDSYQREWMMSLEDTMDLVQRGEAGSQRAQGRQFALRHSWNDVYKQWLDVIERRSLRRAA